MTDLHIVGEGLQQPRVLRGRVAQETAPQAPAAGGFSGFLANALHEVGHLQTEAQEKSDALARGEPVEVHDLMIAVGKSEVAFNLMLEVRNKLVDAWQTLSRSVV